MPISAPSYDPNARAKTQADVRYGAAEAQLNRALEANRMMEAAQKAALDQYGQAGRGVITDTYNQLYGNLDENRRDVNQNLGTQVDLVGQGYRDAAALAEQARADSANRLAQLAGTLRLSGDAQAGVNSGIENLAARQLAASAQDDATRSGNLRTWAAQQDAFMGQGIAQAHREGADRASSFENELVRALAELQAAARGQEYDITGKQLDIANERGAFTVEQANSLIDQLFGQQMQAAQYNLSEQNAIQEAAARAAQLQLAREQFEYSKQGDSLKDMLALSQNSREEKMSGIDYLLKQKELTQMPDPKTIDEWAQANGVDSRIIDRLVQDYTNTVQQMNTAQGLREALQAKGVTDFSEKNLIKQGLTPDELNALANTQYGDPISELVNDFKQGYSYPGWWTDAGIPLSQVSVNGPRALSSTQLRQALGFLAPRS